ncbi:ABC transporter substrate-binding protein [Yoonia litorea]|uniref:Carbohydrate ABC transporter substrate-binding protein, CUT1 family n=1 Tax=Yoonia litorea TaxID=1123755 RepID=A0A1I6LPB9_9RHOB|nr:extracellular solute-binding protein [Yoonia litorea]SFS05315.1 carbohydrate ABC transporter substrate-binding protein, CUT1 family [Yoonia litorea]
MSFMKTIAAGTMATLLATASYADCGIESGSIRILSNDFGALHAMVEKARECETDSVTIEHNATTEHRDLQVAALTANPAEYTSAVVANSSIVPLMNEGLIRPLDDLVAKYGQDLQPQQLITIDGQVMAIAFMANAQHLYYRSDVLEQVGLDVPTTYEEVVAAAQAIRDAGIMENPFAMNTMTGWNLGEEFVNMYLGHGGQFFEPGTAQVSINNEQGVAALNMLKQLVDLSDPDFLTFDSNATAAEWESGNLALATMWGSRGGPILDDEGSTEEIVSSTVLTGAPTVGGGDTPASTLWWDGFTISANISDEDAEATFAALVHGLSPEMVAENNDLAVWLLDGFEPGPAAAGVAATAQSGARPYPMLPFMGLLHTALGNELSDFLQGNESAEQALSDVEAAYTAAAREQGFL